MGLILVFVLCSITVFLIVMAFLPSKKAPELKARIEEATTVQKKEEMVQQRINKAKAKKSSSPLLDLLTKKIETQYRELLPAEVYSKYKRRMEMAGIRKDVSEIFAQKIFLSLIFVTVTFVFVAFRVKTLTPAGFFSIIGGFAFGFFLPDIQIYMSTKNRHKLIERALPFTLDLLKICVEAGLDLNAAFTRVTKKTTGPLCDEISQVLNEVRMGKQRSTAMQDMSRRAGQSDLTSFITIVVQGEKMGMSLGQILAVQSDEIRIKISQRVREYASKIPIKIMFPTVLFIVPSLFIMVLTPAAIMMSKAWA